MMTKGTGRDTIEFVKAAIRRPLEVSTVFPTSRSLAETLLSFANLSQAETVVELGPGTGAITRHLAPRLIRPQSYLGIEIDEPMVNYLRQEYPDLRFEAGPAEILARVQSADSVDVVVSSLPWTIFSDEVQERTIAAIHQSLKPGGMFVTYICANALWYPQAKAFIGRLKDTFKDVQRSDLEWRNIPPAYVFRSIK